MAAVGLAVASVSSSAPLIAYAAAPALAIAFWRTFLAAGVLGPFALVRRRAELRDMVTGDRRREARYSVLAGLALAVHFATWMPSAQLTSVATATALVATQPVWQGLLALAQGRRLRPVMWLGIGIAVAGAVLATGADLGTSSRAIVGDLLALAGGMAAAVYTGLGERARAALSTTSYTLVCYSVCAAVLLVVCLVGGVRLGGYEQSTWLAILGIVAGAQLLGHSMFNYALHKISATTVSMLILLEVPGSAVIAWLWLGQVPPAAAYPGLALLVVGVAVVVLGSTRALRRPPEPVV
ncbi:DMT family transporter [Phytohabitans flavus]